ncbi:MAG: heme-binding protein [Acidobacteria bacterium]|nr:heme-binding protein [Acidobacteriota bacterium]
MRFVRIGALVGLVLLVVLQFVPGDAELTEGPSTALIVGPSAVVRILEASCLDCHSNQTSWPLYSYIAPASWLVTADVAGGRSRLNFSEWEELRLGFQKRFSRKVVERIEADEMPPWQYRLGHWGASITQEELEVLRAWRDELNAE